MHDYSHTWGGEKETERERKKDIIWRIYLPGNLRGLQ
jgi:hypothetical protein